MKKTYVKYHIHDDRSNADGYFDSATNFKTYIKMAKKEGDKAISFSNHGNIYDWIKSKIECDKNKIKYIHGIEAYMCREFDLKESFHIGLYSRNLDGILELNSLISKSSNKNDGHFYRNPRISLDEIMSTSSNIIITTACVANLLSKLPDDEYTLKFIEWMSKNNDRCFLEVQYHNFDIQKDYNKFLYNIHKKYNIRLIAGTDTHSANEYIAECRKISQIAKDSYYGDEDSFDLTWKSYDELLNEFLKQNILPKDVILAAIENTNVMADMVEDFKIDRSFKYPNLYGKNSKELWKKTILKKFKSKINSGEIKRKKIKEYKKIIKEEYRIMCDQGMESFMLFMSELCDYCLENNIPYGDCRGSVGGSMIAYITDITDVDPIVWGTVFSRFCSSERVSLADIDIDFAPEDRELVYRYIMERFGSDKASFILSLGTVKTRGAIDMLAKGLGYKDLSKVKDIKNEFDAIDSEYKKIIQEEVNLEEVDYEYRDSDMSHHKFYSDRIRNDKAIRILDSLVEKFEKLKSKNKDLFYYFDGIKGTIINKSFHPAGMIGSPISLNDNLGTFYRKGDSSFPISSCSMKAVDYCNYVKFDILGLKTIGILKDIYNLLGQKWERSYQIDWNDESVYNNMVQNRVGVFQFEGKYSFDLLSKFQPRSINEMSMTNASLRPSGKSYRGRLMNREFNKNPSKEIDNLLKDDMGYLIFQESTIKFLTDICGFSGGMADTVRRAIGKKDEELLAEQLPKILNGYCNVSKKPRKIAEQEAKEFIQIISDSSEYQFGLNHSTGYSKIGYRCVRFRHYHIIKFITSYLNRASNEEDIIMGTELANSHNIKIQPIKFGFSKDLYTCDDKTIYKGLSSIKDIGKSTPEGLYNISQEKKYENFINLLIKIKESKCCQSNQLKILIKLDYFSEFGKSKYLLEIVKIYENLYNRKEISKSKLSEYNLTEEIMERYSNKITPKLYKEFNPIDIMQELIDNLENKSIGLKDKLDTEKEYLGYLNYKNDDISEKIWYVNELKFYSNNTKPYLKIYNLHNGITESMRINKGFEKNHFKEGAIIKIISTENKSKMKKDENGKWIKAEGYNTFITNWKILSE